MKQTVPNIKILCRVLGHVENNLMHTQVYVAKAINVKCFEQEPKHLLPILRMVVVLLALMILATSSSAAVIWQDVESVASSDELSVAFNNTKIAVRDRDGKLHLVWKDENKLRYGYKEEEGGEWTIQPLFSAESKTVFKPTITLVGDSTVLIAWSEQVEPGQHRIKFTTSDDLGVNWTIPSWVSPSDIDARSVSLSASSGALGGEPFAAISWHNFDNSTVGVSTWNNTSGWTTPPSPIDPHGVAQDAAIAAQDQTLILTWEDNRTAQTQIRYAVSSDSGANWGSDTLLGVSWVGALNSQGGDPSAAFGPDGQILLGYQHQQSVFLVRSDDNGNTFSELRDMGNGLFLHLDIAPNGTAIAVWEEFQGDLHDDSIKRFGSAFSTDVLESSDGPFFVPGSISNFSIAYPAGVVDNDWLDVFWVDQAEMPSVLRHRAAKLTIPGDANFDGIVDVADLGILGENFNANDMQWNTGDFNLDGMTDVADLGILGANWTASQTTGNASVLIPEPTTLSLLAMSVLLVGRRRRS